MKAQTPQTAAARKPSFGLFLAGVALALAAGWMATDGALNGLLDFRLKGVEIHLVAAENPVGFWLAEGLIAGAGLFFLVAAFFALWPRRS